MKHITDCIDQICKLYVAFEDGKCELMKIILLLSISILNTRSDRAIVNKKTINDLSDIWNKKLHIYYCHIHPLETISKKCRDALKQLQINNGSYNTLYGKDCYAGNLVYCINKLRYQVLELLQHLNIF